MSPLSGCSRKPGKSMSFGDVAAASRPSTNLNLDTCSGRIPAFPPPDKEALEPAVPEADDHLRSVTLLVTMSSHYGRDYSKVRK